MPFVFLRRSGRLAIAVVAAIGLGIAAAAAHWVATGEDAEALAAYDSVADILISRTQARVRATSQFLHSLATLRQAVGRTDVDAFDAYASELDIRFQYPGVVAMGFIEQPRVAGANGPWRVTYVQPSGALGLLATNYDVAAHPGLRALLDAARDGGNASGTSGVNVWFGSAAGFVLVRPVYARGAPGRDAVAGFAFVAVDAAGMMEDLAAQLPPGIGTRMVVDLSRRGRERVLYDSQPNVERIGDARLETEALGGEFWRIEVARTPGFADAIARDRSRLVLAFGVLAALLTTTLIWQFADRSAWAEARATEMTAAFKASESRYAEAIETTTDGLWERDETSGTFKVSPRFEALLGHPAGRFAREGFDPLHFVHPADRFRLQETVAARLRDDAPYTLEVRMRHADGHYVWVEIRGRAVRDEGGRVARLIGSITDVSDLHLALERFRDWSRMGSDWFWEQDENYRFTRFSESLDRHPGADLPALIGNTRWDLSFTSDPAEMAAHRAQTEAHQPYRGFEYRVQTGPAEWRWIRTTGKPLYDDNGRFIGYRGVSADISAHKRLEEELRAHRDNLRTLVEAQTSDLMKAKQAAERASLSKSEFLANMSHELRTPMNGILSFARLGHDKAASLPPGKLSEYFDRIFASGERLLELLDNLLDLSKLEAGKMVLDLGNVDLATLVREVAMDFETMIEARRQRLEIGTPPSGATVCGDAMRIAQVVRNLLSNAVKFTPEGGRISIEFGAAELRAGRRAADRGVMPALRMTIKDDGVGIPEAELESVFDKFFQSSKTRTGAGGTGLGLAICEEIVRAHRGTIRARNRPENGGAAFDVVLPRGNSS